MRRAIPLLVALLVASCAGEATTATLGLTTTATTTTTSATTTAVTITTTITTTTVPPLWSDLPPLEMPSLHDGDGIVGAIDVSSICVEATVHGPREALQISLPFSEALSLLGFDVVGDGCEARWVVDLTGYRTSATYVGGASCWSGITVEGRATLLKDNDGVGSWVLGIQDDPPATISNCYGEQDPIPNRYWQYVTVEPLASAYGPLGFAAGVVVLGGKYGYLPEQAETINTMSVLVSDPRVPLFLTLMLDAESAGESGALHDDDLVTLRAARALRDLVGLWEDNPALPALHPYWRAVRDQARNSGVREALEAALGSL